MFKSSSNLKWFVYICAIMFLCIQFFLQIASSTMVPALTKEFNLDEVGISSLSAMLFYGYILFLIPAGLILDHLGSNKASIYACTLLAAGCFLFGYSENITYALIGRLIIGAGSAFAFINLLYVTTVWFAKDKFALLAGIGETASIIIAALSAIFLPIIIKQYSWRMPIILMADASLCLAIIFLLLANYKHNNNQHPDVTKGVVLKTFFSLLKDTKLWLLGFYGLGLFSLISVFSSLWGVPFIRTVYHTSLNAAVIATMMIPLGTGIGCLILGLINTKVTSSQKIMLSATICSALLMTAVICLPNIKYPILLILLFCSGFLAASYIQSYVVAKNNYASSCYGSVMAIITLIIMGGAPILQMLFGVLLKTNFWHLAANEISSYRLTFLLLPAGLVFAFFLALRIK